MKLRRLRPEDETSFRHAIAAFRAEVPPFEFAFGFDETLPFPEYIKKLERGWLGRGLPGDCVPNTYRVGEYLSIGVGVIFGNHRVRHVSASVDPSCGENLVGRRRRMINRYRITIVMLLMIAASLDAADFYVDPQGGASTNDGSASRPWKRLQQVLADGFVESRGWDALPYTDSRTLVPKNPGAPVKAGDTIWLLSGKYGDLTIRDMYNTKAITIAALDGHVPQFRSIHLQSAAQWAFKGLHVSAEYGAGDPPQTLLAIQSHGFRGPVHDVRVENCVLSSAADTSSWSAPDWNQRACNGIRADGTRITLRGNHLKNVNFGVSVAASHSLIESNTVENFSGDGLRGLGDHCVFQYNVVKNCYDVNDNHDDGFQSWSRGPNGESGGGEVVGMVLRGNTIINYTDPNQPHRGPLQGIGCFDGLFVDWVIENNVIIVDHWHGITLLGARHSRIVNNTVLDCNHVRPGPPWVQIGNHKNGTASSDCIVRNNLTTAVKFVEGITVDHNLLIEDAASIFNHMHGHDLSLRKGSPAVNVGTPDMAPHRDIMGTLRPQGDAFDVGAYEFEENR